MAVNETIITGKKFRKLIDEATKLWQRISFWTKASDVEFDDGQTAETKMGAIKGITTDLNVTETGYAADATMLAQLNSEIQDVQYKNIEPLDGIILDTQHCFSIGNIVVIQFKVNITSGIAVKNASNVAKVPDEWIPLKNTNWISGSSAFTSATPTNMDVVPVLASIDKNGNIAIANDRAIDMYGASVSMMYII